MPQNDAANRKATSSADLENSFAFVEGMRIAPISRKLALQIAAQAAIPLVPLILLGTPAPELIRAVIKDGFINGAVPINRGHHFSN